MNAAELGGIAIRPTQVRPQPCILQRRTRLSQNVGGARAQAPSIRDSMGRNHVTAAGAPGFGTNDPGRDGTLGNLPASDSPTSLTPMGVQESSLGKAVQT